MSVGTMARIVAWITGEYPTDKNIQSIEAILKSEVEKGTFHYIPEGRFSGIYRTKKDMLAGVKRSKEPMSVQPVIDIRKAKTTCQVCKQEKKDTFSRLINNPDYQGPCGDSFCYGSCDMDSCTTREFSVFACESCADLLKDQAKQKKNGTDV